MRGTWGLGFEEGGRGEGGIYLDFGKRGRREKKLWGL